MLSWFSNIGVRWKILLAPGALILILIGLGGSALQTLRVNQTAMQGLLEGPVRLSEATLDFSTTIWAAQSRLYQLTATAANETDEKKVKMLASEALKAMDEVLGKLKTVETLGAGRPGEDLRKLGAAAAAYTKKAREVIDMAETDAGSALMFMKGAERSFAEVERLTTEIVASNAGVRDRESPSPPQG